MRQTDKNLNAGLKILAQIIARCEISKMLVSKKFSVQEKDFKYWKEVNKK